MRLSKTRTYKVKKGDHFSFGFKLGLFFKINSLAFKAKFDENCLYKINGFDSDQINKLYGFSQGFHHKNSVRIGWRCLDGKNIEVLSYCYVEGIRVPSNVLFTTRPGIWNYFLIENHREDYTIRGFSDEKKDAVIDKIAKTKNTFPMGYKLYPYFGGQIAAQQDTTIEIIEF